MLFISTPSEQKVTYFFGEPFIEGERREIVRGPRLGVALIAGVHTIGFTTIPCLWKMGLKEFETQ